jgi:transcriptional regulator with XRE-family HTH domain
MAAPRELDPSTAEGMFGFEVRRLREQNGWSQEQLAGRAFCTGAQISQTETASRIPTANFAKALDDALNAGGMLVRLHGLIKQDPYPSWAAPFVELEGRADRIRIFETQLVTGLFQTAAYARAVLRAGNPRESADQIEERVTARLARQQLLTRDDPPHVWLVLDEGILRRPVGGEAVLKDQLAKLLELSESPNIVVQVLPTGIGAHAALEGPVTILALDDGEEVAYVEGLRTGHLITAVDEVRAYSLTYDLVQADALSQAASVKAIQSAMERLCS